MSLPTGHVVFIERDEHTRSVLWVLRFPVEELRYAGVWEDEGKKHYAVFKLSTDSHPRRVECASKEHAAIMVSLAINGGNYMYSRHGVPSMWVPLATPRSPT